MVALTNPEAAVDSMIREWHAAAPGAEMRMFNGPAEFLAESRSDKAVRALATGILSKAVDQRLNIVRALGHAITLGAHATTFPATSRPKDRESTAAYLNSVEELLVRELTDLEPRENSSYGMGSESFTDPRPADLAAYQLGQGWPTRYPYVPTSSRFEAETRRVTFLNTWRQAHGLELLPLPIRPQVVAVAESVLAPLLQTFLKSPSEPERTAAGVAIQRLGAGALPAVMHATAAAAPSDRMSLQGLANRVSCIVREVRVEGDIETPKEIRDRLIALKGAVLDQWMLRDLITEFSAVWLSGFGLHLTIDRDNDGSGVAVIAQSRPSPSNSSWGYRAEVSCDGKKLTSQSGGGSQAWSLEDPLSRIGVALASPPKTPFHIGLTLYRG
jgi:hypothetical protein